MAEATPSNGAASAFPFSAEGFSRSFDAIRPLILQEWPQLTEEDLVAVDGDPEKIVEVVRQRTQHSRALIRKHLSEIAEVAGVDASGLEARLLRLVHALESQVGPVREKVKASGVRAEELADELGERGKVLLDEVKQTVPRAEEKLKENLWTTLLAALGLGLLVGLVVGLSRGR